MKSKILMLVVALMLVLSTVASADALNQPVQDDLTGSLTISGQIEGYGYADAFTIAVFKAGKSYSDIAEYTPEEMLGALTHFGTYMTDAEGNYEVVYSTKKLDAGDYTVVLTANDGTQYEKAIFIASRDSKVKFIGEVADLVEKECTVEDLKAKLNLKDHTTVTSKVFEILEDSVIFTVDEDELYDVILYNISEAEDFEELTPEDFVAFLEDCAYIQSVNEGLINAADYAEMFGLSEEYMATYEEYVTEDEKAKFADYLKGNDFMTHLDIAKKFNDVVVLNVIENADAWADYKAIIEAHGADIGVKMSDYDKFNSTKKNKISSYMKNSYSKVDKFVEDVNDAIKDIKNGKSSGGGGGGSSSSGSSSGRGTSGITGADISNYPIDMTPKPEKEVVEFTDLEGFDWAKEAIEALAGDGVIAGVGEGQFAPGGLVTREQFVKMIVEAFDLPKASASAGFEDVVSGAWYEGYADSAVESGIVSGIGEGLFGVGMNITREDAAVILYRAAKLSAEGDADFADKDEIASYALDAVKTLNSKKVINGTGDGRFAPKANCSRAEAAVMIYRLLDVLGK